MIKEKNVLLRVVDEKVRQNNIAEIKLKEIKRYLLYVDRKPKNNNDVEKYTLK